MVARNGMIICEKWRKSEIGRHLVSWDPNQEFAFYRRKAESNLMCPGHLEGLFLF